MRIIAGILAVLAIGGGVAAYRPRTATPAPTLAAPRATAPAPSGTASQHNWPKKALDRAGDVKRQVLAERKSNN